MENNIIKNIYKISHIIDGDVKYIFVFIGKTVIENRTESLEKLFLKNLQNTDDGEFYPIFDPIFDGIFIEKELKNIVENNIQVKFIPENIYLDDTIEIIKKKLLLHLMNDLNTSFDELYFFIEKPENFKALSIY